MGVISTQGFLFRLIANDVQLDLFDDEDIFLSDNVTGLFDLGVLPSDFTRQITVPGTKTNNAFFEHVYDISVVNPYLFATNQKVPCYFDFGAMILADGYLQLNKVNVLANKFIDSYEITIYGGLSSFARIINRTFLTELSTLSAYNHTASYANISASWNGNLFSGAIVYPLADYGSGWNFTNGSQLALNSEASPTQTITTQDFKPAIRAKLVWDAIFAEAGYTYSSSFFSESWWDDVYMICNYALKYPEFNGYDLETFGVTKISSISGSQMTNLQVGSASLFNLPWYNVQFDPSDVVASNGQYTLATPHSSSLQGVLNLKVNLSSSFIAAPSWKLYCYPTASFDATAFVDLPTYNSFFLEEGYALIASGQGQNKTYEVRTTFSTKLLKPGSYQFALEWNHQFNAPYNNTTLTIDPGGEAKSFIEVTKVRQAADGLVMEIPNNMPFGTNGIKQIDFLTSIQKKFNLVMYPDKTTHNQFIVAPYTDWYKQGEVKDFNRFINLDDKIEVIPANNLAVNQLNFGDTLDQDYISQQFSKEANREFGKTYYTDTQNFFSQGTFDVKTRFGNGPLVQLAGTGVSGSVGGVPPPPTTYYSYVMGNVGYTTADDACDNTYYYPNVIYASNSNPAAVTRVFTNNSLTTGFNGGNQYWKWGYPYFVTKYASQIDTNGYILSTIQC